MANLLDLPCLDEEGHVRVVVEAPKGSTVKLKYEPALAAFQLQRFIAAPGYPYDWGFVPSTQAADGDPLDALVIHGGGTWPGVIVPSLLVGVLKIVETLEGSTERRQNDRLIAVPATAPTLGSLDELNGDERAHLEHFFVATGQLAKKRVFVEGWGDARDARQALDSARATYMKSTAT